VGFQRGHLPHPDRGLQRVMVLDRAPEGTNGEHRGAGPQTLEARSVPPHAEHLFVNRLDREGRRVSGS
jgi:hypothetical protein